MTAATRIRRSDAITPVVWLERVEEGGIVRYRVGRQGRSFIAEWPRIARLTCRDDGSRVVLVPQSGASERSLSKVRGAVRALVGGLRGGIGLHASAVAVGDEGVVILGKAGAGKSTAAAELCQNHGARLLADDATLLIRRDTVVRVSPSEHHHYLTHASGSALGLAQSTSMAKTRKSLVPAQRAGRRSYRLAIVVALRFDDSYARVASRRLSGAEAALQILGAMFRLGLKTAPEELDRVMHLYQQVPFIEIARPRRFPSVGPHILQHLGVEHVH